MFAQQTVERLLGGGWLVGAMTTGFAACAPPQPVALTPPSTAITAPAPAASGRLVAYASGYGPSIDLFSVDPASAGLTRTASFPAFGSAPSFLAVSAGGTNLYALDESAPGRVGAYAIDPQSGALTFLDFVSSGGNGPAHLSIDRSGHYVFVANYGDGSVAVLPVDAAQAGRLGAPTQTLSAGAQAHMILADPSNRYVFVPCKGADYIAQYLFDASTGKLTPNAMAHVATAKGAGPRHLAFHPSGRFAYLINELDNTLTAYAFDRGAGTLAAIDTQSTLPSGYTGKDTAAEVWVHPSGQWVFGSNRGDDSIALFAVDAATGKLTPKGHTKTGGEKPRAFALDASGALLYVANQGSSNVVPFRFDVSRGALVAAAAPVAVASATFVGLVALPGK